MVGKTWKVMDESTITVKQPVAAQVATALCFLLVQEAARHHFPQYALLSAEKNLLCRLLLAELLLFYHPVLLKLTLMQQSL